MRVGPLAITTTGPVERASDSMVSQLPNANAGAEADANDDAARDRLEASVRAVQLGLAATAAADERDADNL